MDCRTCQPTLLDLAHGELAPELAVTVREHVRGCASCGAALAKLEGGIALSGQMTWLEPPRSLRVNALALAERQLQERAQKTAQARAAARPRASFVQAVLDFIGRMAAGRQVAMATIMMLIVAVGLWSLPELQRLPHGEGVTVVSPDPAGEAAPSGGLAPAEPLDLAVDARSRRIRSREELAAASNAYKAEQAVPAAEEEQVAVAMAEEPPPPELKALDDDPLAQLNSVDDVIAPGFAEQSARSAGDGVAMEAREEKKASSTQRAARKSKSAFPENDSVARLDDREAEAVRIPSSPAPVAAPAPAKPAAKGDLAAGAVSGSGRQGERAGATAPASTSAVSTTTALGRARQTRAAQGCAAALPEFADAVKEPATQGVALVETAACLIELGRFDAARASLERARKIPQVASRARDMLAGIDAKAGPQQLAPAALESPASDEAP